MIVSNIAQARDMIEKKALKLDTQARQLRDRAMAELIRLAKEEIQGKRGSHVGPRGGIVWDKAESGKPPMNRTGNLRKSITAFPTHSGFASYEAIVGPTMIYSRKVELGGAKWKPGTKFLYMQPAFEKFTSIRGGIVTEIYGGE